MVDQKPDIPATSRTSLPDGDYVLTEGAAWFRVKKFSVRIHATREGIVVDVCVAGHETEGAITTAFAFDAETAPEVQM